MSLYKRKKWYWTDVVVNGTRYREPLGTTDKREAPRLERERIAQLQTRAPDPAKKSKSYSSMDIEAAVKAYIVDRRAQVSPRMVAYWNEEARPLAGYFKKLKLKNVTPAHIAAYQNARLEAGRAPKTVNGEVSVLRQLLKHARLWYRFREDYKPIPNHKLPVGKALTEEEQARLFEVAQSRSDWLYAHAAATLAFYCGMRSCEIKALKWENIDLTAGVLEIRRSKTPAGWRNPTLNDACKQALANLYAKASLIGATNPEHHAFPWHGREQKIDPTRPITSWRTAWRSILHKAARNDEGEVIYPGLQGVRFHDGRHTALTTLCEKGLPDWVIQAQVGHIAPQMMKTYSHVRRLALDQAAAALEPNFPKALPAVAELVN
jgi:integrase